MKLCSLIQVSFGFMNTCIPVTVTQMSNHHGDIFLTRVFLEDALRGLLLSTKKTTFKYIVNACLSPKLIS